MKNIIKKISKSSNNLKFEHVVIIPVYNECVEDVLQILHSIALQRNGLKCPKPRAVVFNINNSTSEGEKCNSLVYKNNLTIFFFLQELVKIDTDVSSYYSTNSSTVMEKMIKTTRDSLTKGNLFIKLIDSFSMGNTRTHNKIGFAREIATRYAVDYLIKDENSLIFSTDADCIFSHETMSETDKMFTKFKIDLTPLNMDYHFNNLDSKSCQAAVRYKLSRLLLENLVNISTLFPVNQRKDTTNSVLLEKSFSIGGAFTVMRAGKYAISQGYPDDFKEDLYIVANIKKSGGIIRDLRKMYPKAIVYTSPRISDRVPSGYGTKIANFSRDESDFFKYQVTSIEAHLDIISSVRNIEKKIEAGYQVDSNIVSKAVNDRCSWMNTLLRKEFIKNLEEIFSSNPFELYSNAHWNLSNKTKKLLRNKLLPQQTIGDQIKLLENAYCKLGPELLKIRKIHDSHNFLEYQSFKKYLFDKIKISPKININKILPVTTCCIANSYIQIYVYGFRNLADTNNNLKINDKLLKKCEKQLLKATIYGYKGEFSSEIETLFFKRLKDLELC